MTLRQLADQLGLEVRAGEQSLDKEVAGGIACDLLSVVMSKAEKGFLWLTVQGHPNIVAVALLGGLAGIVVTHGFEPERDTIARAEQEGVAILTTSASSYACAGRLHDLGLG